MRDAWTARKAEGIEGYVDLNGRTNFFSAIKVVCSSTAKVTAPLLNADRTTLVTEKTNFSAMGRALQECPQPPLYYLRSRQCSSASGGEQRRTRPPDNSPRNRQGRATACGSSRLLALRLCHAALLSASHSLSIRCWDARGWSLVKRILPGPTGHHATNA
ncbi:hypothetical protein SprV_0301155200 [Sparganum proliferum]